MPYLKSDADVQKMEYAVLVFSYFNGMMLNYNEIPITRARTKNIVF